MATATLPTFETIDEWITGRAIVQLVRNLREYHAAVPECYRTDYGTLTGILVERVYEDPSQPWLGSTETVTTYTEDELLALSHKELLHVQIEGFKFLAGGYKYELDKFVGWMSFKYESPVGDKLVACDRIRRCGGEKVLKEAYEADDWS